MPAVTTDTLQLPRVGVAEPNDAEPRGTRRRLAWRPLTRVVSAVESFEGEGFRVRRPFPGRISLHEADPFLLLDQMGGSEYQPYEARGAPDHPHRGFETVTYLIDGELEHRDSTGGGGVIRGGDTQWMTAGAGLVHSEMPTHDLYVTGGLMHGVQLWVNLPRSSKLVTPRYQDITGHQLTLLSSRDGGALIRLIAGDLGGHSGPGHTHTPITYAHATVAAGAELTLPWRSDFNAPAYVLVGDAVITTEPDGAGSDQQTVTTSQLAMFGDGDALHLRAAERQPTGALEVLLLGGRPIREPIFHYGPFVMNTRAEVLTALDDFQRGRMGIIPPKTDASV